MKEQLEKLVEIIINETGQTQEQIAQSVGYGKNYISDVLTPSGKVSKKFLNLLKIKYSNILSENTNNKKNNKVDIESRLLRLEAIAETLQVTVVSMKARTKEDFPKIFSELQTLIEAAVRRRIKL